MTSVRIDWLSQYHQGVGWIRVRSSLCRPDVARDTQDLRKAPLCLSLLPCVGVSHASRMPTG